MLRANDMVEQESGSRPEPQTAWYRPDTRHPWHREGAVLLPSDRVDAVQHDKRGDQRTGSAADGDKKAPAQTR